MLENLVKERTEQNSAQDKSITELTSATQANTNAIKDINKLIFKLVLLVLGAVGLAILRLILK
jgi:hypothetical protein